MISKTEIIEQARSIGFDDIGFTSAEPFAEHGQVLASRQEYYSWISKMGLKLEEGIDPETILPGAKSIIVLLDVYFREAFPPSLEGHFGRCYLDDDRVTRDGLSKKIKLFRSYLRDNRIESKVPFHLPHRAAAARAGLGTFGKNCLLYANKVARKSSWVIPVAVIIDHEFSPDDPSVTLGCPDWCRNACIAACPTKALSGPRKIDPQKCISYLSYFGEGITPMELREPMGMYIYGCDRCQNVCPRNAPWLAQELSMNSRVSLMADDFDLVKLLHMDKVYFEQKIWPHMFYAGAEGIWRWKMNVARVMGNSLDKKYIPDLIRAVRENADERVQSMAAWALGRIGGKEAATALDDFQKGSKGMLKDEIRLALEKCRV
ncbi:MAG TPA: epoxyqueuosine reductase [Deltaproteobacteria bacterium]|nr:epoxyqueuosine reductase [Deltaproteobacteria bacterium]